MEILNEISSKVKSIFIELKDYSFYHNPSEIGNSDTRFLGRKKQREKLKNLLTNNETKSGAYLITGYRGMGKSSFVNKVISEVSNIKGKAKKSPRFIRIFLFLLLFTKYIETFDNIKAFTNYIDLFFTLFAFFSGWYLIKTDSKRNNVVSNMKNNHKNKWYEYFSYLFLIEKESVSYLRFRAFISDVFIISFIIATSILINIFIGLKTHTPIYTVLYLIILFMNIHRSWKRIGYDSYEKKDFGFLKRIFEKSIKYINFSHRFYIRLNLAYDNLQEIEILKMIARQLQDKYEIITSFKPFCFPYFIWKTFKILFFFIVFYIATSYVPANKIINQLRGNSIIIQYLPSQGLQLLRKYNDPKLNEILLQNYFDKNSIKANQFSLKNYYKNYCDNLVNANISIKVLETYNNLSFINKTFVALDTIVLSIYLETRSVFKLLPKLFDYFKIILFLLLWQLVNIRTSKRRIFGHISHGFILNQIKELNDLIDAQISNEVSNEYKSTFSYFSFGLKKRKQKNFAKADVREIEKNIIKILDNIDTIPRILVRPQFVFIFDELDKIEPYKNIGLSEKEYEKSKNNNEMGMFQSEISRNRQHTILALLSNLKHFLTTSRAKFIFIAGREMYDASLADVSDRHFFMGSIFNDVIYINSFLTDTNDEQTNDVTSMTETYVCQMILPENYFKFGFNLKTFNKYLTDFYLDDNNPKLNKYQKEIIKLKREKIIFTLHKFINYLTYRSNGAPKKLTSFFEKNIINYEQVKELNNDDIIIGKSNTNLYLSFNIFDQYTFGIITYISYPFITALNSTLKAYSDKLIFSIPFLVDHLYKYHSMAFAWRNIELTPEILDIHKVPELRDIINNIIKFLSNIHVMENVSGLYDFKFLKKISEELAFLSKISEQESAALNFSLDESFVLKNHYKKRLKDLKEQYNRSDIPESDFIYSIAYLHMILGDLYFYDKEYDDALLEYQEAVQNLRKKSPKNNDNEKDSLILLTRNMLKIGYTLEKKKSYSSVYMIYGKLTSLITKYRDIDLKTLKTKIFNKSEKKVNLTFLKKIFSKDFTPDIGDIYFNMTLMESSRILYQPFLAKLYILEKLNLSGINRNNIILIEKELIYLTKSIDQKSNFIIISEFYNHIANLLYFKNGVLHGKISKHKCICSKNKFVCKLDNKCILSEKDVKNILNNGRLTPCSACEFYFKGIKIIINNTSKKYLVNNDKGKHFDIFNYLQNIINKKDDKDSNLRKYKFNKSLAKSLSNLGDTILGCSIKSLEIKPNFFNSFLGFIDDKNSAKEFLLNIKPKNTSKIELILLYFFYSSVFFRNAGERKKQAFQLMKIIYVLREYLSIIGKEKTKELLNDNNLKRIEKKIIGKALRGLYLSYENIHRLEINKFNEIFNYKDSNKTYKLFPFLDCKKKPNINSTSMNSNSREIILIYLEILIKYTDKDIYYKSFGTSFVTVDSIYNRIIELRVKGNFNFNIFKSIHLDKFSKVINTNSFNNYFNNNKFEIRSKTKSLFDVLLSEKKFIEFLIVDSIYCFYRIIKFCNIYGISYLVNHSLVASAHYSLSKWIKLYDIYYNYCNKKDRDSIKIELKKLIGNSELHTITESYHQEMALRHFRSSIETHNEGKAYKNITSNMHYLNDDYNDNLIHFCAGLERYRINSEKTKEKIDELSNLTKKKSGLYQVDNYY